VAGTTIRILEKKGYVRHSKDGRAHVYVAKVRAQGEFDTALEEFEKARTLAPWLISAAQEKHTISVPRSCSAAGADSPHRSHRASRTPRRRR